MMRCDPQLTGWIALYGWTKTGVAQRIAVIPKQAL
jgi:hypothetical protein